MNSSFSLIPQMQQAAQEILPIAGDILVENSFYDPRLGKIVGGLALSIFGGKLLLTAISVTLKPRVVNPINIQNNPTTAKTTIHWTAMIVGLAALGFGIYNVIKGLSEYEFREGAHLRQAYYSGYDPSLKGNDEECAKRVREAQNEILRCPDSKKLWDEVQSEGKFKTYCGPFESIRTSAMVKVDKREIYIANNNPDVTNSLIFELANLKQSKSVLELNNNICSKSPETYAFETERVEYRSNTMTFEITEKCINKGIWPKAYTKFITYETENTNASWRNEEEYLADQFLAGHTQYYIMIWRNKCKGKAISYNKNKPKDEL